MKHLVVMALVSALAIGSAQAQTCVKPTGPMPTMQPTSRPNFRPERWAAIASLLITHSYKAIALGDSILEGFPPDMFQAALGPNALNVGFGMDGTEQLLWRLETLDWSRQTPSEVLLMVGTDDLRYPYWDVVCGIRDVIEHVHRYMPATKVLVLSILPRGQNMRQHEGDIDAINRSLSEDSKEEHYVFINAHDDFLCDHKTPCALSQAGNLHLTRAGYVRLTSFIEAAQTKIP
jgi:lysophospholipase L1-like esterase